MTKQWAVMRRSVLEPEHEGKDGFVRAFESKEKAELWIAAQAGEYLAPHCFFILEGWETPSEEPTTTQIYSALAADALDAMRGCDQCTAAFVKLQRARQSSKNSAETCSHGVPLNQSCAACARLPENRNEQ